MKNVMKPGKLYRAQKKLYLSTMGGNGSILVHPLHRGDIVLACGQEHDKISVLLSPSCTLCWFGANSIISSHFSDYFREINKT